MYVFYRIESPQQNPTNNIQTSPGFGHELTSNTLIWNVSKYSLVSWINRILSNNCTRTPMRKWCEVCVQKVEYCWMGRPKHRKGPFRKSAAARRSFAFAAPTVWNSLNSSTREQPISEHSRHVSRPKGFSRPFSEHPPPSSLASYQGATWPCDYFVTTYLLDCLVRVWPLVESGRSTQRTLLVCGSIPMASCKAVILVNLVYRSCYTL